MNIQVIGIGQCGARLADEFYRQHIRAKNKRGLNIVNGAYAVSTDMEDLVGLTDIATDYKHRMLIAADSLHGLGVKGDNALGARVMQEHADVVLEEIRQAKRFFETDAVLVIAGAAGGIGSGALPVLVQRIKQRFPGKIVYALVVLPFGYEEEEDARTAFNTAVCLKSVSSVADAVFLVDNELYKTEDFVKDEYSLINPKIVAPFYNLLCAGAEKRKKHIGAKLLDAGDIIQTLGGWTVIGSGRIDLPVTLGSIFPGKLGKTSSGTGNGIRAMDEAIGELSWLCRPEDAASALYLISAPAHEIDVDLIRSLGDYLKKSAPNAVIRSGDYPVGRGVLEVTVIVSRLNDVARVRYFYSQSVAPSGETVESPEEDAE